MTATSPVAALEALDNVLVLRPDSFGFAERRMVFNIAVDRHPTAIAIPRSLHAAREVARLLVTTATPFTIRAGGHNVRGTAVADGAVMVDLSLLRRVVLNRTTLEVTVEPGALWGDIDTALEQYSVAVPGGTVSHTGVAGLTLGGGVGWLAPFYGLSCDNLIALEYVDGAGQLRTATATDDLWAFRGAGSSLGFVTEFRFRAQPIPRHARGFRLEIDCDSADAALTSATDLDMLQRRSLAISPAFMKSPSGVATLYLDGLAWHGIRAVMRWLAASSEFSARIVWTGTYYSLQRLFDTAQRFGRRNYWKTVSLSRVPGHLAHAWMETLDASPSPLSMITLDVLAGRVRTEPLGASAIAFRPASALLLANAIWDSPELDASAISWARKVVSLPEHDGLPPYSNYASQGDIAYLPSPSDRLAAVKRRLDPHGAFPDLPGHLIP